MTDNSDLDPWKGVAADKARHPRLAWLVDNIWILSLNRVVNSVAPALIVAVLGYAATKLEGFNTVAREFPQLVSDVRDIAKQVRDESVAQGHMIDHVKEAERDIQALKMALGDDQKAIVSTQTDAAAAKARVDDIKEDLRRIETLASQNLQVSRSHDADIRATRNAVAPQPSEPPY